jgi:DNA-directed RNA polymerase subunit A"
MAEKEAEEKRQDAEAKATQDSQATITGLPEFLVKQIDQMSETRRFNKTQKEKFTEKVRIEFLKSSYEPGEVVGIVTAQSISEPATQMTMRTYHFAGSAGIKVTYGLPRLIEIFDAKKTVETPIMTVFLKRQFNNMEDAKKVAEQIIEKGVGDVAMNISLNLSDNSLEIKFDKASLADRVEASIKKEMEGQKDIEKIKKTSDSVVVVAKPELGVKELQKLREKISDTHVMGIGAVSNAVIRREGDDWVISTIGSNLEDVLKIAEVDETRTYSNDLHETKKILGIEATRNLIISESFNTLQEQGLDVDIRHLMLVSDIMTVSGDIRSIGRYGVAGTKSSILARAAFEETIKHLVRASIRGEVDSLTGIFENVMIGQLIPSGTGMFELIAKFEDVVPEEAAKEK